MEPSIAAVRYSSGMDPVLEKLRRELVEALDGLSAEQTQVRRAAGKWTIQQIVEHLLLTYRSTAAVVEARVAKGTATRARPGVRQRLGQFVITGLGVFPHGRRSPEMVAPVVPTELALSGDALGERVGVALSELDAVLERAGRIFGVRSRAISHALLGPMSVAQWRRFHLVHGEHHLKQMRQRPPQD